MSTTAQDVLDAAIARSTANEPTLFTGKTREVLIRVNTGQQRLFTRLAQANRYFYVQPTTAPSSNAASARTLDLGVLTPPAERLLVAKLPSGVELSQVDLQDLEAELAPRFYPLGTQLVEVNNEWGAPGIVTLSLWYAYRPAELDVNGALTQLVTVPDRFAGWLDCDLAIYIVGKDFGRMNADPTELKRLTDERDAIFQDYLTFVGHHPGPSSRRYVLPTSTPSEKA